MTTTCDDLLVMRGITKDFSGVQVLTDVNFTVRRGEVHSICGENGAGKSTLMKILTGVYPHTQYSGVIEYEGSPVEFKSVTDAERVGIAIIHQELALIPEMSIAENVFLGQDKPRRMGQIDWNAVNHRAQAVLAKVGLHENVADKISTLGVAKQQMVEIAKALSKDAKLLILDEPTAALNDEDSKVLLDIIRGLQADGVTIVIISHKLKEIEAIADRTTIIRDGRTIDTLDMRDPSTTRDRMISLMVGRSLSNLYPEREVEIGSEALRITGWNVDHPTQPGRRVLHDVALDVRHGEVVGIAGLMGAGRTELAMSIFGRSWGLWRSGTLTVDGREVALHNPGDAIRHGLAYASEDRKGNGLNQIASIKHNMTAAAMGKVTARGFIDSSKESDVAQKLRQQMTVRCSSIENPVQSLSGGNQQKVVLAKWWFTDPEVLILDEPTRGIDVGAKYEIYSLINDMAQRGKAVIVVSSELEEILGICDRIFVMAYGRITGEVRREDATQENLMTLMTREPEMGVDE